MLQLKAVYGDLNIEAAYYFTKALAKSLFLLLMALSNCNKQCKANPVKLY